MTVIRGCPTSPGGRPASQSQPFHIDQACATLYFFIHLQCRMYEHIRLIPISTLPYIPSRNTLHLRKALHTIHLRPISTLPYNTTSHSPSLNPNNKLVYIFFPALPAFLPLDSSSATRHTCTHQPHLLFFNISTFSLFFSTLLFLYTSTFLLLDPTVHSAQCAHAYLIFVKGATGIPV